MMRVSLHWTGLTWLLLGCTVARAQQSADLTTLSLESLLETRVSTASKYEQRTQDVPATIRTVTRAEILAFGWRTLSEALTSLPGFHLTNDRQYDFLGVRGFGLPGDYNTRLLIAINGNRVNDVVYDAAMTGREFPLDMELVERIEVLSGPGGAIYGQNAMFAVINIITRNGQQVDGGELTLSRQDLNGRNEANLRWGKVLQNDTNVLLSLSTLNAAGSDLYLQFPGAAPGGGTLAGLAEGLDGQRDADVFARITKGGWSFDLVAGRHRKYDPTGTYFSDHLAGVQYQSDTNVLANLQYQNQATANTNVVTRLFSGRASYRGRLLYAGDTNYSTGESRWVGGEARMLYTGMQGHEWLLGVEMQNNLRIDQGNDYTSTPWQDLLIPLDGYRVGFYLQDQWQLHENWTAVLGLRLDHNDVMSGTHLSPRAALIWQPDMNTTVKTLYGHAYRVPNAYEMDYDDKVSQVANLSLAAEHVDTYELVVERQLSPAIKAGVSAFRWTMHDLVGLGFDTAAGLPQFQSGPRVLASGVELTANGLVGAGGQWRGSLSWQDVGQSGRGDTANSPAMLGRINYTHLLGSSRMRASIELRYEAGRLTRNGTRLPRNTVVNLALAAPTPITGLEATLAITNVFDHRYDHPAAENNWQNTVPQDGRGVRLQVSHRF